MSQQLHTFFTNVLKMPHYANDHAGSGVKVNSHEQALRNKLLETGYSQHFLNVNLKPSLIKRALKSSDPQVEIRKLLPDMLPGTFVAQPCDTQNFPDFIICDFTGNFIVIEAKSTTSRSAAKPQWNGALPLQHAIYIFTNREYNQTTIFRGCDVIDPAEEQYLIEEAKLRKTLKMKVDKFNRGWGLYNRAKYDQWGGGNKTDYFVHPDRRRCEQNVLEFAKQ